MRSKPRIELERYIDLLQDRLDGIGITSDTGVSSPDDKTPFVVCQILRIFDERLAEVEAKLDIT
jgi:hypothetical protein